LDDDEMEDCIERLAKIMRDYGTLGIELAMKEMDRRVREEGEEYVF
jgi:hypothetical protein